MKEYDANLRTKKKLLDTAVVRLANHPPALSRLRAQLEDGTFPRKAAGLLLLDTTSIRWAADTNYADRKLEAFIDAWLEQSNNITPLGVAKSPTSSPTIATNKLRRNTLDVAIDKAIKQAGCLDNSAVWLVLKDLALAETPPFTGEVVESSLGYTNDENKAVWFLKNALCQRLRRRRKSIV